MADKELQTILQEIAKLKKKKERELVMSKSVKERNQLLKELKDLEEVKKSPSKMKAFGKTYLKGLKMTGKILWGALQKGSRNLESSSPEYQNIARDTKSQPVSKLAQSMIPRTPKRTMPKPMPKKKKKKSRTKPKAIPKKINQNTQRVNMAWDLP